MAALDEFKAHLGDNERLSDYRLITWDNGVAKKSGRTTLLVSVCPLDSSNLGVQWSSERTQLLHVSGRCLSLTRAKSILLLEISSTADAVDSSKTLLTLLGITLCCLLVMTLHTGDI